MSEYLLATSTITSMGTDRDRRYLADQWGRSVPPRSYLDADARLTHDDREAIRFETEAEATAWRDARHSSEHPLRHFIASRPSDHKGFYTADGTGFRVWDRHLERVLSKHATRKEAQASIAAIPE